MTAGLWYVGALFVGMLLLLELGRRLRQRRDAMLGSSGVDGLGVVEASAFGLLGLLMAFTLSGVMSRFGDRRQLIIDEANAVHTAYMVLELLPSERRGLVQESMRRYVDARLAFYRALPDTPRVMTALQQRDAARQTVWSQAVTAVNEAPNTQLAEVVLPPLSEAFEIGEARVAAIRIHTPRVIYVLLGVVTLLCALLAGYDMGGTRNWLHMVALSTIIALTLYAIVDIEYPRLGLHKLSDMDRLLVEVRERMR